MRSRVIEGDCRDVLPTLSDASFDCVFTDPPYPEIDRPYGRLTAAEWFDLMDAVVPEVRRVLKPTGSAVFVLQPNSERVGRMRTWLWEFMAKWGREWGIVQDAYWWNITARPGAGSNYKGLMREGIKPCVWLGHYECFRDQSVVFWGESDANRAHRLADRLSHSRGPSNHRTGTTAIAHDRERWAKAAERGGVTPFNVLPIANSDSRSSAGARGHGAGTPRQLTDWWLRYICPPGGSVLDPFVGSGTTLRVAEQQGKASLGIERMPQYVAAVRRRIDAALAETPLFATA